MSPFRYSAPLRHRLVGMLFWSAIVVLTFLLVSSPSFGLPARFLFFFIGDGMGFSQVQVAESFRRSVESAGLTILQFPVQGEVTTHSLGSPLTDSAAAGTAFATGHKASFGVISLDPTGRALPTLAERARDAGLGVGIVTSVALNDATPAAFYAHQPSRLDRYEIGLDLIDSGFDFFAGWGLSSRRGPQRDREDLLDLARQRGFTLVTSREALAVLNQKKLPVLALLPFPFEIEREKEDLSLGEITARAIDLLDHPLGFFLMVEGGKIDWACHTNDAASAVWETIAFDEAVAAAVSFLLERPEETLIVVTGDHETGGMSFCEGENDKIHVLAQQKCSYETVQERLRSIAVRKESFPEILALARECYGLWAPPGTIPPGSASPPLAPDEIALLQEAWSIFVSGDQDIIRRRFGGYHPVMITLNRILSRRAGVGWSHFGHSPDPVPVFAWGAGQDLFYGKMDNTDIFWKILEAAGWSTDRF
ncbi:MAG TPA: alkaline phosphatase [Atribacteraceae bacterium]|nr:alkaline phosphatase [Atribacteraceae bacterium]